MIIRNFLDSRGDNQAFLDQFFIKIHVEILVDLPIVTESHITVLFHVFRPNAVNSVDGAALEFVKVA